MNKKMIFVLTWLCSGSDIMGTEPTATTIAVSENKEKLSALMREEIAKDCEPINEDDYDDEDEYNENAWDDTRNYEVTNDYGDEVYMSHRMIKDLYSMYRIELVNVL